VPASPARPAATPAYAARSSPEVGSGGCMVDADLKVPQFGDFERAAAEGPRLYDMNGQAALHNPEAAGDMMLPLFGVSQPFGTLGAQDLSGAAFPGLAPAYFGGGPMHSLPGLPPQHLAQVGPSAAKPSAAGAHNSTAVVRAQRTSARQAAKAKQQAAAATKGGRKRRASPDDDSSSDDDDDAGRVPQRPSTAHGADLVPPQPKPHDIAKTKYNHIEDEKERKRLKRLLRNRVSAQQARERKKAYLGNLETQQKAFNDKVRQLEQKIASLERENFMLRQVVKTTGAMADGEAAEKGAGGAKR